MPLDRPAAALCDPVTLEIIRGAIMATQREMEALIERTAISAFIREKKDFYTALFDGDGVMAVGSKVPIFGDLTGPVFKVFPKETMRPGDVYWYNDCYASQGAVSHSNDQVLLAPVFREGRLAAFVMSWAHFADIGGLRAGSISPDTTEIFQEGIIIPPTKLIDAGVTNEATLAIFHRNSRFPDQSIGDMSALVASVELGVTRVGEIADRFGVDVFADALAQLLARTRALVRQRLAETFDYGTHRFTAATVLAPGLLHSLYAGTDSGIALAAVSVPKLCPLRVTVNLRHQSRTSDPGVGRGGGGPPHAFIH